jgi:hypothetical protein
VRLQQSQCGSCVLYAGGRALLRGRKIHCCVAPWRAQSNVIVAPNLNTTYAVMPGPVRTVTASDVGSATAGAVR